MDPSLTQGQNLQHPIQTPVPHLPEEAQNKNLKGNKKDISTDDSRNSATQAPVSSSQLEKLEEAKLQSQMRSQTVQALSGPQPSVMGLEEVKSGEKFQSGIEGAKNAGKKEDIQKGTYGTKDSKWFGAFVHVYEIKEYQKMTKVMVSDRSAGVAIKSTGDIVSLFKHPNSPVKDFINLALPEALKRGGTHLDCFAGDLPIRYSKYGFMPVAKAKFDDAFMPPDWNLARDSRPDIIFMAHDPQATIEKDVIKRKDLIENAIVSLNYSSYDEAVSKQAEFVKEKNPKKAGD